jgi:hypothetical protein
MPRILKPMSARSVKPRATTTDEIQVVISRFRNAKPTLCTAPGFLDTGVRVFTRRSDQISVTHPTDDMEYAEVWRRGRDSITGTRASMIALGRFDARCDSSGLKTDLVSFRVFAEED